ncbi:MAG: dihydroorotase [Pseudomonadales bacterium]|nr:dihydroorotase [Pseudomonadales bacterium]MBL6815886.1 dihydroorotase [Pseudomonadales bacterium]MCH1600838.1 dihydroorotase [Pseudomonadales bacterium]
MTTKTITITKPDDWHLHLRDGEMLGTSVPHTARSFSRAIVMPNLKPPVTTVEQALAYRQRILDALPTDTNFSPLMTLYLTDNLAQEELVRLSEEPAVVAVKYYPAGATTNSDSGVSSIDRVMPSLEVMAKRGIPLLIHGEVTDGEIDIFDREQRFIDTVLAPLRAQLPELKVVLEHITTANAVEFVSEQNSNVAATITVHHLLYNRNHLLAGGVRPHFYCLPVLKRNSHQLALIEAATSGNPKFFLGTDSAPHPKGDKEAACGCAGIYTAPGALELYAEVFDQADALDRLEGFASLYGPRFYGLPVNTEKISLVRDSWQMEESFQFGSNTVIPVRAGETLHWRLAV